MGLGGRGGEEGGGGGCCGGGGGGRGGGSGGGGEGGRDRVKEGKAGKRDLRFDEFFNLKRIRG